MLRHGYQACSTCHVDPSGGELLTPYGRVQGDLLLRMRYGKSGGATAHQATSAPASSDGFDDDFDDEDFGDEDFGDDGAKDGAAGQKEPPDAEKPEEATEPDGPSRSAGFLWGLIAPEDTTPFWASDSSTRLLLGGSYRTAMTYKPKPGDVRVFPMQADIYGQLAFGDLAFGGSLGAMRVAEGSPHGRAAQVTTNQGEEFNLISRTHYVSLKAGSGTLIRGGRLNLPFGVRIPEHVLWTREATQTDRESDQQHGLAVSHVGSDIRLEVMGILGNYQVGPDEFRERGGVGFAEYKLTEKFALGASSLVTVAKADRLTNAREDTTRGAHGLFARIVPASELMIMIEADALHRSRNDLGYTGFIQGDYEVTQGLHLGATGEVLNTGAEGSDTRLGGWLFVNWFFLPHLDLRVDGVFRQNDEVLILSQVHAYL